MRTIDVYYDYRSPYAFFLSRDLPAVAQRLGIDVCWRPVSIHMLLNLQVGRDPRAAYVDPLPPIKRKYLVQDVVRGARRRGIAMAMPKSLDSLAALQVSVRLGESEAGAVFRERVWQATWLKQRDVADRDVLVAALEPAAADAARIVDAALADEQAIEAQTVDAFSKGVFGVPTMVAGGEVFFGADRLDALAWWVSAAR
jgi:2-hydroxychromene-2-carboxylate isomerase